MTQMTSQFRVVEQTAIRPGMGVQRVALFDANGDPLVLSGATSPEDMILTGFTTSGVAQEPVAATDDLLTALAKLESRLAYVEQTQTDDHASLVDHETRITALEGA